MSASHGCTDDMAVVEQFKEALKERIGTDRYQLWFQNGVEFHVGLAGVTPAGSDDDSNSITFVPPCQGGQAGQGSQTGQRNQIVVDVRSQFAADRMKANFLRELRAAAMQASDQGLGVRIHVLPPAVQQTFTENENKTANENETSQRATPRSRTSRPSHAATRPAPATKKRRGTKSLSSLLDFSDTKLNPNQPKRAPASSIARPESVSRKEPMIGKESPSQSPSTESAEPQQDTSSSMTLVNFIGGASNRLAITATKMACQSPGSATPLFFHGPTGSGKSHLLHAIADQLRRRHRMRRVVHLSAEHFTNDFIKSVGTSGLSAFRRRYRDVDALLIDDIQFVASKKATLRELLYTIETLLAEGRPMVFTASRPPSEIPGLTGEVIGRMTSGLVCPILPLCQEVRFGLLDRLIEQRCPSGWPDSIRQEIGACLDGDGRLVSGVVNLVSTLQRMYGRMPSMDEIHQFGGDLLRSHGPPVTLASIERAVCRAFNLDDATLRGNMQTRTVSEPRMLAMYLSRQLTSSAYSEIAGHYGGRSHSTAISASKKVAAWIDQGKAIGRGQASMSAKQAIDHIEQILRTG